MCGRATAVPAPIATMCSKRCAPWKRSAIARPSCICLPSGSADTKPWSGTRISLRTSGSSGPRFLNQSRRRVLQRALQARQERAAVEAGRNRVEHFDQNRAGKAQQRPARPKQSGIKRQRHAGDAGFVVKMRDAGFVAGAAPGGRRVPSGKMTTWRERAALLRARAVIRDSADIPAPRSMGMRPALAMYQPNNGIHISSRLRT